MKRISQSGITLLELMISLTVLAVVVGLGIPAFGNLIKNNRIAADTNDLVIAFHAGRSEAVKQRSIVVVCASSNATDEEPGCSSSFQQGWIAFVDRNGNGELDLNTDPALSDAVIEAHGELRQGLTVASDSNYFAFSPSGFGRDIAALGSRITNILLCDDRGNVDTGGDRSAARLIAISNTGRPQILTSVSDINDRTGGCP